MRLRVCVFEDDDVIRSILWHVFDSRGHEVLTFQDPSLCPLHLAPECQCQHDFACADVIISDMKMPNVKGLDFVRAQRKKGCKCLHIALMSGGWSEKELLYAAEMGCKVFNKPFDIDEIDQWLDEVEASVDPGRELADWPQLRGTG